MDNNTDHVDKKEYRFAIRELTGSNEYACYDIETDIPGYQRNQIVWAVTPAQGDWFQDNDGFLYVNRNTDCTITALYNYKKPDGSFYSATYKQKGMEQEPTYTFEIVFYSAAQWGEMYTLSTNIPGCTASTAAWTITTDIPGYTAYQEENYYFTTYKNVPEDIVFSGMSYTVTASYTCNGKTYSSSYTYTY